MAFADGSGGFLPPSRRIGPLANDSIGTIGDVDGDGHPDLFTIDRSQVSSNNVSIYRNTGGGAVFSLAFSAPYYQSLAIAQGNFVRRDRLVVADFNVDGCDDCVFWGTSSGVRGYHVAWGSPTNIAPPSLIAAAYLGPFFSPHAPDGAAKAIDYDRDGILDLCVQTLNSSSNFVFFLRGLGAAGFAAIGFNYPSPINANSDFVEFADLDVDGRVDVVGETYLFPGGGTIATGLQFLRGLDSGNLASVHVFDSGGLGTNWLGADFDGDGDRDYYALSSKNVTLFEQSYVENQAIVGAGCSGAIGTPRLAFGPPISTNAQWGLGIENGAPGSFAAIVVATGAASVPTSCIALDAATLLPSATVYFSTLDATGAASETFDLTLGSFEGLTLYLQGIVVDPSGSLVFGGTPLSVTAARGMTITFG